MRRPITEIIPIKTGSRMLQGSYEEAEHHAQDLLPFLDVLAPLAKEWGFKTWKQGVRVHEFVTSDERRFTLRPIRHASRYVGVRLFIRLDRSNEVPLMDVTDLRGVTSLSVVLSRLARPLNGELICSALN